MKVACVELEYHPECLDGFCKIFSGSQHQVTIFTTAFVFSQLEKRAYVQEFEWVILQKPETVNSFLHKNLGKLNQQDWILFGTIASNYKTYLELPLRPRTILRVHNAYTYFAPLQHISIFFTPYYLFKAASYVVREFVGRLDFYYIPKLIRKMDYIIFPDKAIANFALEQGFLPPEKIGPFIPTIVHDGSFPEHKQTDEFVITIPGSVDKRRKNYGPVLEALRQLQIRSEKPVRVVLLGKIIGTYGQEIAAALTAMQTDKLRVQTFSGFVSQAEFDDVLARTSIILAPVTEKARFRIYTERYGSTKISGSISDTVRSGRPVIFPSFYKFEPEMAAVIDLYENPAALAAILQHYLDNPQALQQREQELQRVIEKQYAAKNVLRQIEQFFCKR